jgi:pyridoxal phosphate enzyme (YggS family)
MDTADIAENLADIEARIAAVCRRSGRSRDEVTLVAVSKTFPAAAVDAAVVAGIRNCGENRVQELREKHAAVLVQPRWHLIGHLQSNKAKDAIKLADVIQTIDSFELAEKVSKAATAAGKMQEVLVQVNAGDEPQKSGVPPAAAAETALRIAALPSLHVTGLMAIPPAVTAEEARPYFAALRTLRDTLVSRMPAGFGQLSMGMSEDFEVAIEEGATMVRIGRAIFGSRTK